MQVGITGTSDKNISSLNTQNVLFGMLPLDPQFEGELAKNLKEELVKAQKNPDQMQAILHQMKKLKSDANLANGPSRTRIPLPAPSASQMSAEIEKVKEASKKVALGRSSLPSVCCFTFHNTYEGLLCLFQD